uniref:Nuclear pore complex protein Nup98-Nup96 n=1 Tax=Ciona savignyi TaxID=51511 RepID=H2YRB9_CIOSA
SGGGNLFGTKTTSSGGMFGSTNTFGATTSSGFTFGSNTNTMSIFGTPAAKTSGGLFSTPATQQQGFGSTASSGFGFGRTAGTTPFGTTTTSSFGGGLFGATSSHGTTVKFNPTTGSDTMVKGGVQSSITTKHQCITAMKEYEGKSVEELRVEDYIAGRKGPGTGSTLSQPASSGFNFGQKTTSASTGFFGSSTAKIQQSYLMFKSIYSQPAFGTAGAGLFNNPTNSSSLFQSKSFGAPTTASTGFTFGGTSTAGSLFGNTAKPTGSVFGTASTSSGGLFDSSSTGAAFGSTNNTFGAGGSLFGNKTTGFGTNISSGGFGGGSLFGQTPKTTSSIFSSSTFGQNNTGSTLFGGSKPTFGNKTGGNLFGTAAPAQNTFSGHDFITYISVMKGFNFAGGNTGVGLTSSSAPMFNQASNTTSILTSNNQQSADMLQALISAPFGDSPLFKNALLEPSRKKELLKPTNPAAQKAAIQSPVYRVSPAPVNKIKPKVRGVHMGAQGKPHQLFAGLDHDRGCRNHQSNLISFIFRSSVKRLAIKVTPNTGSFPGTPNVLTTSTHGSSGDIEQGHPVVARSLDHNLDDTMVALNVHPPRSMTSQTTSPTAIASPAAATSSIATREQLQLIENNENVVDDEITYDKHPGGIILTRPGYFTIPSMKELAKATDHNGVCKVSDFTVYGSVFFEGELELTNMDLDSIVHIRRKEITVYPDDNDKP